MVEETNGGTCTGKATETVQCKEKECPGKHYSLTYILTFLFKHPIARNAYFCLFLMHDVVDCEWDDWTIGNCSSSCGGGTRTNTRSKKINAKHGGKECDEPTSIDESCNVQECPGHTVR